jgi:hypothetical protein
MAKQIGDIIITGTIDDITFYEMDGKGYARHKSSLTGKRVKRDPRFKRTMQSAHRLGKGSQLASKVYRSLPRAEQVYALFKELKRIAILALKEGKREEEVMMLLLQRVRKESARVTSPIVRTKKTGAVRTTPSFTKKLFRVRGGRREKVRRRRRTLHQRTEVLRE